MKCSSLHVAVTVVTYKGQIVKLHVGAVNREVAFSEASEGLVSAHGHGGEVQVKPLFQGQAVTLLGCEHESRRGGLKHTMSIVCV